MSSKLASAPPLASTCGPSTEKATEGRAAGRGRSRGVAMGVVGGDSQSERNNLCWLGLVLKLWGWRR